MGKRRLTTESDADRTGRTGSSRLKGHTRNLTVHTVEPVTRDGLRDIITRHLRNRITERFLCTGNTERGHNDLVNLLGRFFHHHVNLGTNTNRNLLGLVADVGVFENRIGNTCDINRVVTVQIR